MTTAGMANRLKVTRDQAARLCREGRIRARREVVRVTHRHEGRTVSRRMRVWTATMEEIRRVLARRRAR